MPYIEQPRERTLSLPLTNGYGGLPVRLVNFPRINPDRDDTYLMITPNNMEQVGENIVDQVDLLQSRLELPQIDSIVAVATGGYPLAVALARELNTSRKVMGVGVQGYNAENQAVSKFVDSGIDPKIPLGVTMLVDGMVDRGPAGRLALGEVWKHHPDQLVFAAGFRRDDGTFTPECVPDIVACEVRMPYWLQFYYDQKESRRNWWNMWQKDGLSEEQILKRCHFAFRNDWNYEVLQAQRLGKLSSRSSLA